MICDPAANMMGSGALRSHEEEAADCRRKALAYLGLPEAPFLLRIAREFDRLASERVAAGGVQR